MSRFRVVTACLASLALVAVGTVPVLAANGNAKIPHGGTLYAQAGGVSFGTRNFNPFSTNAETGTQGLVYEPLLMYNPQGAPTVRPWLAASYVWSHHNLVLTMKLRQGIRWQDATSFSAKDVVFTFDLLRKYPALDVNALWTVLSSVQAHGPATVVFTFKQADVPLLYYLGSQVIVPAAIWSHHDPVTWQNPNPVGTGPFELCAFSPQEYTYCRNAHYWQTGRPYVSKVVYISPNLSDLYLELREGKLTWAGAGITKVNSTYVAADPKYNRFWFARDSVVALVPNDAAPPFNNADVRIGLAYDIPYQVIVRDQANPAQGIADPEGLILPAQRAWLDNSLTGHYNYHYDPQLALRYLKLAGYHRTAAGRLVNAQGTPLAFTLQVSSTFPAWITVETVMAATFNNLGMQVTVHTEAPGTYFANLRNGNFQAALDWMGSGPSPYYSLDAVLNDIYTAPLGHTASGDVERWRSQSTQGLLAEFTRTSSPATEHAAMNGLETTMVKYLPVIPLFYGMGWDEYVTKQFVGWPDAQNPYCTGGSVDTLTSEPTLLQVHLRS